MIYFPKVEFELYQQHEPIGIYSKVRVEGKFIGWVCQRQPFGDLVPYYEFSCNHFAECKRLGFRNSSKEKGFRVLTHWEARKTVKKILRRG